MSLPVNIHIKSFVKTLRPENTLNLILLFSVGYFFRNSNSVYVFSTLQYVSGIIMLICLHSYGIIDNNRRDKDIDISNKLRDRQQSFSKKRNDVIAKAFLAGR